MEMRRALRGLRRYARASENQTPDNLITSQAQG
jgi:hypothetical protein